MNSRQGMRPFGRRLAAAAGAAALVAGVVATTQGAAQAAAPTNDDFAHAQVLTGASATATGNITEATTEIGEPRSTTYGNVADNSIWYSWKAPATTYFSVSTDETTPGVDPDSAVDTTLSAFTGTSLTSLHQVATDDDTDVDLGSNIGFNATAGTTYYFQVGLSDGSTLGDGAVTLTLGQASVAGIVTIPSGQLHDPQNACIALVTTPDANAPIAQGCVSADSGSTGTYAIGPVAPGTYYVVTFSYFADGAEAAYPTSDNPKKITVTAGCTQVGLNVNYVTSGTVTFTAPTGTSCPLSPGCTSAKSKVQSANATLAGDRNALVGDQKKVNALTKKLKSATKHHKAATAKKLKKQLKKARSTSKAATAAVNKAASAVSSANATVAHSC